MTQTEFTPEILAGAAGVLLSLLFSYLPGLSGWYQRLGGDYKRLVMLGALLAVSAGALGISCLVAGQDLALLKR